jgi:hypothetical protein
MKAIAAGSLAAAARCLDTLASGALGLGTQICILAVGNPQQQLEAGLEEVHPGS